ncbi:stabilizer of axonemal microtubules 2-like [Asterias rubens]|uniref:stabilizer of axonemal microtubules 2-like n=1 Tax=Asterias rubens TaxID=7604 RepID=UPI0014552DB3|nr:stabilizer of axonemal microtubules 2-like [Asterias rubens]
MTRQCICQICTCGRHRCPHKPHNPVSKGPCVLSEYTNKYKSYPGNLMRDSFKPKEQMIQGTGTMADATTHRVDFVPRESVRPPIHQQEPYRKPSGGIDLLTSYTKDYPGRKAEAVKSFRGDHTRHVPSGEFRGNPTYADDFRKWDLPAKDQGKGYHTYVPPSASFDGLSTFARDFQPKKVDVRQSLRPAENTQRSDAPFEDRTSHKVSYIPHAVQARYVREQQPYQKSQHKFDGLTTFQRDFMNKNAARPDNFKPDATPMKSDLPFEDNTTFKSDYKKWDCKPMQSHVPDSYQKPAGDMDLYTTNRLAYQPHQIRPASARRPVSQGRKSDAPFDDRTNYTSDFRKWESMPERRGDPSQRPYEKPEIPFAGTTNYRAQYIPKHAAPAKSMGPDRTARQSSDPFDDRTFYKLDFTAKEAVPCPAVNLPASGFNFTQLDQRGHELWVKNAWSGETERVIKTPQQQISIEQATYA